MGEYKKELMALMKKDELGNKRETLSLSFEEFAKMLS